MESLEAWLTLRSAPGIGDGTICKLVRYFGGPNEVLSASVGELRHVAGRSSPLVDSLLKEPDRRVVEYIRHAMRTVEQGACSIVTIMDDAYPVRLAMIHNPPPLLYVRGTLPSPNEYAIAIVGSRKTTPAGVLETQDLSQSLAAMGFTIVSGMARGIDAAAHQGALAANARTVAVLGCGVDRTYPPEHASLRRDIEANGAVVSELPLGAPPLPYHFPLRNRIVSGWSLGVIVTEAGPQSGALITARFALEQNREVFAVPGSIKQGKHQGAHSLIQQGAKLVEAADDVVEELLPQLDESFRDRIKNVAVDAPAPPVVTASEQHVLALFNGEPVSVDEVLARASLDFAEVMNILLGLELKGVLKQVPGSCYIRR